MKNNSASPVLIFEEVESRILLSRLPAYILTEK